MDGWERILAKWSPLEGELLEHFANASAHSSTWPSGTAKTYFTYLLLDPRISNDLPMRCERMDLMEVWRTFAQAIFYVGKGTRGRPYEHLHEALRVWKESKTAPSLKVGFSQCRDLPVRAVRTRPSSNASFYAVVVFR